MLAAHPGAPVSAAADTDALIRTEGLDLYAPCALGGALDEETVPVLTAAAVCGAANNQLAHPGVEKDLAERGILYAPDYVVNAGGVIQVADELHGFDFARAKAKAEKIRATTTAIFERAEADGVPPGGRRGPARRAAHGPLTHPGRGPVDSGGSHRDSGLTTPRRVPPLQEGKIATDQHEKGRRGASDGGRVMRATYRTAAEAGTVEALSTGLSLERPL